jgi:iron complex transport system permease protein
MVGVTLIEYLGFLGVLGATLALGSTHLGALAGALATMAVVYALGQRRGWIDPLGLLLVGVIVNAVNGSLVMFFSYLMPANLRGQVSLWAMGYFNENVMVQWPPWSLVIVGGVTVAGLALAAWFGRAMDLATLSDDEAQSMGLNLRTLRLALFALAGMLTAGSIVLAGPIGFVGLICPHFVRLMIGPSHRPLIIGAALAGAALVIAADGAVKLADLGQGLMPIGILTSLIGGPVFLWMLHRRLGGGLNP